MKTLALAVSVALPLLAACMSIPPNPGAVQTDAATRALKLHVSHAETARAPYPWVPSCPKP